MFSVFSQFRRHGSKFGDSGNKITQMKLQNRLPIDDEEMLKEMDRIEEMGGDPFFLTPENWIQDDTEVEDEVEMAPSVNFITPAFADNSVHPIVARFATDGKGPTPKEAAPKSEVWQGWDGIVDENAHLGIDDE